MIDARAPILPTCTVVIPTRDRASLLDLCIDSVKQLDYPTFDILVVDNDPPDSSTRDVAEKHGVQYVLEPRRGLDRARNTGGHAARGAIVAFIDDDAIVEREWLKHIVIPFGDPEVMVTTGCTRPTRVKTEAEILCHLLYGTDLCHKRSRVIDRTVDDWYELTNFGGAGNGMNMAFRKRAFDLWPGFHERLDRGTPLYSTGEHYAFYSLVRRGYRLVYVPDAVVFHPYPATIEEMERRFLDDASAVTGYLTLLLLEEPRYSGKLVKFLFTSFNKRRAWREPLRDGINIPIPRWKIWRARLLGPWLYVRSFF